MRGSRGKGISEKPMRTVQFATLLLFYNQWIPNCLLNRCTYDQIFLKFLSRGVQCTYIHDTASTMKIINAPNKYCCILFYFGVIFNKIKKIEF